MNFYNEKINGNQKTWRVTLNVNDEKNMIDIYYLILLQELKYEPLLKSHSQTPKYIMDDCADTWTKLEAIYEYNLISKKDYYTHIKAISYNNHTYDISEIEKLKSKSAIELTNDDIIKLEIHENYYRVYKSVINAKHTCEKYIRFSLEAFNFTKDSKYAIAYKTAYEKFKAIEYFLSLGYSENGYCNHIPTNLYENIMWFSNHGNLRNVNEVYYHLGNYNNIACEAGNKSIFWAVIGLLFPFMLGTFVAICERGISVEKLGGILFLGIIYGAFSSPVTIPLGLFLGFAIGKARHDDYIESHKPDFVTEEDPNKTDGSEILAAVAIGAVAGASSAKNLKGGWINK